MKKTLFAIITAVLFAFILSASVFADIAPCIEVSSVCVDDGECAEVSIDIKNNPGISTMYIKVDFEYPLQLIKAESSGLFGDPLFSEINSEGHCVLSWDESLNNADNNGNGTVARLEFYVPENTPDGVYEISVSYDAEEIYDSKLNNVSFEVENGSISVGNTSYKEYKNTLLINEAFTVEGFLSEKKDAVEVFSDGRKLTASEKIKSGDEVLFSDGSKMHIVFLGDINADGKISAQDARIALRNSVELEDLNGWQTVAANTDFEKSVTAKDARMILRASVELENSSEWFIRLNSAEITASAELASLSADDSKEIGEYIRACVENFDETIDLSGYAVNKSQLSSIIEEYIYYVPSFFCVKTVFISLSGSTVTGLQIVYIDDAENKCKEYKAMLDDIVRLCDKNMSEVEIALFYHDYICENFSYDNDHSVFNAYDMLKNQTGVCQAYSLLYMDILGRFGIDSVYVKSDVLNHGWTLIEIGGSWYHVDVTWDDPVNDRLGRVRHDYFLLSDNAIRAQKHKQWEVIGEDIGCKNTKYDNAFWHGVETSFVKNGRLWYYIGKYEDHYAIFETSLADGGKAIYELRDKWMSGQFSYWKGYYSGLAVFGGRLIYNTADSIKAYSVQNGSDIILYKFSDKKSVYGFVLNGDIIKCNFNTSPDEKMKDIREMPLTLIGDVNSDALINAKDYTVLIRYINSMLTQINDGCADYNCDGKINAEDAKELRYALVNR